MTNSTSFVSPLSDTSLGFSQEAQETKRKWMEMVHWQVAETWIRNPFLTCGFSVNSQRLQSVGSRDMPKIHGVQLSIKRFQKWRDGFGTIFFQHLSYIPWLQTWDVCGFNISLAWLLDLDLTETRQPLKLARIQRCRWFHMRKLCPPRKFPQATEGRYDGEEKSWMISIDRMKRQASFEITIYIEAPLVLSIR